MDGKMASGEGEERDCGWSVLHLPAVADVPEFVCFVSIWFELADLVLTCFLSHISHH
jgi:hypothetical protein